MRQPSDRTPHRSTLTAAALLLNYTDDMLALLDTRLCVLEVNMACARKFDKEPEALKGISIEHLFAHAPAYYQQKILPILENCLRGTPARSEHWVAIPGLGDRFLDLRYDPVPNDQHEISGIVIVGRDRTELMHSTEALKRSETERQLSEEQFRKDMQAGLSKALRAIENQKYILDQHAIVSITDTEGRITYVNDKFLENTGYARDQLIGHTHRMLRSGVHKPEFYAQMWRTVRAGQVWQGEICNLTRRGTYNWVHTTIVPLKDESGKLEEFMSVRTDVTDLKRTEESLRRAQKMEAIGQLTGGIAHDFNNLLGIVIGNLDLLEHGMGSNAIELPLVENARNAAMRGSVLTRRLLNFSRQTPIAGSALDLNPIIRNLDVLLSKSLTAVVEISMDLHPELWLVEVDPGDFEDALINLALNASDAMPTGGKLRFTTRNHASRQTEYRNNGILPAGQYVEISVEDNGAGIPYDIIEKIFDPYFTTKSSEKGSGLGLAMVYGFVKRSKGQIFVDSVVGHRTRFTLYLPRAVPAELEKSQAAVPSSNARPRASQDETILLVDDEADILKITGMALESLGYRVIGSSNAEQALEVLQRDVRIDLLFTDVVMPGKYNGFELADMAQKLRPGLPTLITSGYAREKTGTEHQHWHNMVLPKPYRSAELARRIRTMLDEKAHAQNPAGLR